MNPLASYSKHILLYLCFVLCGFANIYAEQPYRHVQVLKGIDDHHVMFTVAEKDPFGSIWLVSGGELYRYDGVHVVPFSKLYEGKLPFDEVQTLAIDPWGRIWLNTRNGILIFDLHTWRFCFNEDFAETLTEKKAQAFCQTGEDFFVATESGEVWQIERHRKTLLFSFIVDKRKGRHTVGNLFTADDDRIWLAVSSNLYGYDRHQGKHQMTHIPSNIEDCIEDLLPLNGGVLIRNYRDGYYIYDGNFRLTSIRSEQEHDFTNWNHWGFVDGDRVMMFNKDGQYLELARDTTLSVLKKGYHRLAEHVLYKRLNAWRQFGDEWLLATDQGLYAVFPSSFSFDYVEYGSARGMFRQNNYYYFGGYGFLYRMPLQGSVTEYRKAPEKNYYATYMQHKDTAYVALESGFLGRIVEGKLVTFQPVVSQRYAHKFSDLGYCLTPYKGTTLLIGTSNGIWQYDIKTNQAMPLLDGTGTFFSNGKRILSVRYLEEKLTYSTEDGYYVFDGNDNRKRYPEGQQQLMIYDHLKDLGFEYLATKGRGVVVLTDSGSRTISVQQGLGSNTVYQLFALDGALFAGTHRGLSIVTDNRIFNYRTNDGLPFEEFNHQAIFYDMFARRLFMGGIGGYVFFNPKELLKAATQKDAIPEPRIAALHVGLRGNRYKHHYAADALRDTIVLSEDALTFNMDFARPDFYRHGYDVLYKIDPLMDGFQQMASSGQITLVGLRPGEYKVHVRILPNNGGVEKTWTWLLVKQPAFVETQGFYALVLLSIAGLVTYIILQRAKRIKDEKTLRKQISRDLHDEVGGLLTGISMQADLLSMNTARDKQSSAASIGQYSREAVQMMDDIIWAIDARNNGQDSLQERMEYLAFQMLEPKGIRVLFDDGTKTDRKIPQIVRQNTYLLFKEILHNIVKHAQAEWVSVSLLLDKRSMTMEVRNNGVKDITRENKLRKGQGMRNMETRARQMNGTISVTQDDGVYTVQLKVNLRNIKWAI
jgi:signal transduction histidine kinase